MGTVNMKDVNGDWVIIDDAEILLRLREGMLFGLSFEAILEMRKIYINKCGSVPGTKETVREAFKELV